MRTALRILRAALLAALLCLPSFGCVLETRASYPADDAAPTPPTRPTDPGGADPTMPPGDPPPDEPAIPAPPLVDAALPGDVAYADSARRAIDDWTLAAAFAEDGFSLPAGTELYAARIVPGVDGAAAVLYEAGGGAFSRDFWPASTVKVLAALGALDHARARGFSSAAMVTFDSGFADRLGAIMDRAIRVSSNEDYDRLVRVAGFDRLNDFFLPANGFTNTAIQRSYVGFGVRDVPGFTLVEDGRSDYVPRASSVAPDRCPPRDGNCTNLFELTEALRRVVLRDELPEHERFDIAERDLSRLEGDLLAASPSFFARGVERALGPGARIFHKPGWVRYNDCLDHGVIEDPTSGARYLLAVAIPEREGRSDCVGLSAIAEEVLSVLRGVDGGAPLEPDAGVPIAVQIDGVGATDSRMDKVFTVEAPGADLVELFIDGFRIGRVTGTGPRFEVRYELANDGERLLVVRASHAGTPVGVRTMRVSIEAD